MLVFGYFLEFEKSNAMNMTTQMDKSLHNLTLGNAWVETKADPNMTMLAAHASEQWWLINYDLHDP